MTGLCGGVSRTGGMCGALLGGIAAIGMLCGRDKASDDKTLSYNLSYHFADQFECRFGSKNCAGVLPCDISTPGGANEFKEKKLGDTFCPGVAETAAGLVQDILNNQEKYSHPLL